MDKRIGTQPKCICRPLADSTLSSRAGTPRRRLKVKGLDSGVIAGYLRDLANILASQSAATLRELNSRLRLLG